MPIDEKARRADFVIRNDGTVAELIQATDQVIGYLLHA